MKLVVAVLVVLLIIVIVYGYKYHKNTDGFTSPGPPLPEGHEVQFIKDNLTKYTFAVPLTSSDIVIFMTVSRSRGVLSVQLEYFNDVSKRVVQRVTLQFMSVSLKDNALVFHPFPPAPDGLTIEKKNGSLCMDGAYGGRSCGRTWTYHPRRPLI